MRRYLNVLVLLSAVVLIGCGGPTKGINKDYDRPNPTPPTNLK